MTHPPHADPALSTLLLDSVDITDTFSLDARLQQVSETVTSSLALGGPVSALLIFMSMVSVAIILFKSIELTQETLRDKHQILQALFNWKRGRNRDATRCLSDAQVGLGRILWVAMQGRQTSYISEAALSGGYLASSTDNRRGFSRCYSNSTNPPMARAPLRLPRFYS
jgi:hypothetical protein